MSSTPAPARTATTKRAKSSTARTPSPTRASPKPAAKKSASKPRASSKKKKEEEAATGAEVIAPKSETKKRAPRAKKEPAPAPVVEDEEITSESDMEMEGGGGAIIFIDEDEDLQLVQDLMKDTTGVHNVIRVHYFQQYAIGIALIASVFSNQVPALPFFSETSEVVRLLVGSLFLGLAFTFTAVAQSSFSAMKKSLQYNMFYQLLVAFFVILKHDGKVDHKVNTGIVGLSLLNVALNMWACYYRNNELPDDDDEEDAE